MKGKRLLFVFITVMALLLGVSARIYYLSTGSQKTDQTAGTHGNYTISIGTRRGTIYDTKMRPIVNENDEYIAAVSPLKDLASILKALMPHVYDEKSVLARMQQGKPFIAKVNSPDIHVDGVTVATIKERYPQTAVAPHVIGYLNSEGAGVSGVEKAYNDILAKDGGTITANFAVDALGRTLQGVPSVINQPGGSNSGIELTIDKDIQLFTQNAADKYLKAGAVVVMDAQNGDILACDSVPRFTQNNLSASLKAVDSPMLNRAFSAYDVGSVFKIVLAAEALETGISPSTTVDCKGKIDVAGKNFNCLEEHGVQNMAQAISNSCNVYFITLGQQLGGDKILEMANKLGLGKSNSFAPNFSSASGVLPTSQSLKIPAALANFSFGQGDLMATPVQIARMMCAVADDGLLPTPRLVKGIVSDGKIVQENAAAQPVRVFSSSTAGQLKNFLIQTVDVGTGAPAKPEVGGAGGKTSTAQTGWLKNGKIIDQAWFAGFYPADSPKYVIVVIAEAGNTGGSSAGPVFKDIADHLAPYCGLTLPSSK